jgi:hypothetical protein
MSGNKLRAGLSACILYTSLACTFRGADAAPSVVHGPKIDAVTYSSARVTWITDKPFEHAHPLRYQSCVHGRVDGRQGPHNSQLVYLGADPQTTIHYQVCSADGTGETCSPNQVFTTLPAPPVVPAPPEPPRATVNTAMPEGAYGPPFFVAENCSNLPAIFKQLAALEGDLNYEVRIPARTECYGQYHFPNRPNHHGWVVVLPADDSKLPPPGTRVSPESTSAMPVFVTNPLPARVYHSRFVPSAVFPRPSFLASQPARRDVAGMPERAGSIRNPRTRLRFAGWRPSRHHREESRSRHWRRDPAERHRRTIGAVRSNC